MNQGTGFLGNRRIRKQVDQWAAILLIIGLVGPGWARAQSAGATGIGTPAPPFLNVAAMLNQVQTIQTSCNMSMIPTAVQGLASAFSGDACSSLGGKLGAGISVLGGTFSMNTSCPPVGKLPEMGSCAELNAIGKDAFLGNVCTAISGLSCRKGKMDAIKGEVDCLAQQANLINQQLSQLQQAFTLNIQQMQKDVAQLDLEIKDREAQVLDINDKLNGRDGAKGLLELNQSTQQTVVSLPSQIEQIRLQEKGLSDERKKFENDVDTRTMGLVDQCFNSQRKAGFQCERNGPPVTAREYALCRLQQESQVGVGGELRTDKAFQEKAASQRAALDSVFQDIFGAGAAPDGAQGLESGVQELRGIRSSSDFSQKYGSSLGAFNKQGLNIQQFVTQEFGRCLKDAQSQVDREKKSKDKELGQKISELDNLERKIKSDAQSSLSMLSQQFSDAMGGLTGTPIALNVNACRNATTASQVSCLDDARRAMEELQRGTNFQMTIQGNNPAKNVSFACTGLEGCVKAMQNASKNIERDKVQFETFKQNYVMKAKQDTEAFRNSMRQMLSPYSAQVSARLQAINGSLAGIGIGSGVEIPQLDAEEFEFDENGLPLPPKSILHAIGGGMTPPLLDVTSGNFSSGVSSIADGIKDIGGELTEAQGLAGKVKAQFAACEAKTLGALGEAIEKKKDGLELALEGIRTECAAAQLGQECSSVNTALQKLTVDINALAADEKSGLDSDTVSGLDNGLKVSCPTPPVNSDKQMLCDRRISQAKTRLKELKDAGRKKKKATDKGSSGVKAE